MVLLERIFFLLHIFTLLFICTKHSCLSVADLTAMHVCKRGCWCGCGVDVGEVVVTGVVAAVTRYH